LSWNALYIAVASRSYPLAHVTGCSLPTRHFKHSKLELIAEARGFTQSYST